MKIKGIVDEDFINFKYPSMFIALGDCDWKCCKEQNLPISICQNSELAKAKEIEISVTDLFNRYCQNKISCAIVIGGLEPMTRFSEIISLISYFRGNFIDDYFVIFTGYDEHEIDNQIAKLKKYNNIIVKFGRYIPKQNPSFNKILGVELASDNQYVKIIS